jgi:lipoprotein-anchoring transpeptidase ErfK/SrfK
MMDSNESSSVGGRANTTAVAAASVGPAEADDGEQKPDKPAAAAAKPKPKSAAKDEKAHANADRRSPSRGDKASKNPKVAAKDPKSAGKDPNGAKSKAPADAKAKSSPDEKEAARKGDGVYGVTRRRGEGTFQLRDVPFIQYFESGYALHAAYWHDVFGTPRSHGCVNLSPVDAHRIFLWTDPPLPEGWHAVNAGGDDMGEGTTVIIHE